MSKLKLINSVLLELIYSRHGWSARVSITLTVSELTKLAPRHKSVLVSIIQTGSAIKVIEYVGLAEDAGL